MILHAKISSPSRKKKKPSQQCIAEKRKERRFLGRLENIKSSGHQYSLIPLVKVRKLVLDLN
ncbi:hypothetical protein CW704_05060 [Candidatus Bathyarchaeota archaeon]|nr:MAG: hypothetical protein CW704_05060 [Candidatus Bathyarchaeota archaeon]